jgi:PTH1 family peptidyl-tRNA hydrolase
MKIAPEQILVAHDELDLLPGIARFKLGGGHGGHNGLRDTITHIGQNFWRLRLGIGHPGDKSQVIDFVLQRASAKEEDLVMNSIVQAAEQIPVFIEQGAEKAMHVLHSKAQ